MSERSMQPGTRGPCPAAVPGYLPPVAPPRPALNDREIARMQFRRDLLQLRGFPPAYAERWADVLHHRDWTGEDRHLCAECWHLRADWTCREHRHVVVDRLQRCESFVWQTPKGPAT